MSQVIRAKVFRGNNHRIDLGQIDSSYAKDATVPVDDKLTQPTSSVEPDVRTYYSEDLSVGDFWITESRIITREDVERFADLTGDHTALHSENAPGSPYNRPIAHGLLALSILSGMGSDCPRTMTLALAGIENWDFKAPVYLGDRVKARAEIVSIEAHGRRAVKVRWLRQLLNESGQVVQEGHFVTLVGSKSRQTQKPR